MPIDRRLFLGSLAGAVVVSIAGGYAVNRIGDDDDSGTSAVEPQDAVTMDRPGVVQDPTIGTNAVVEGTPLPVVELEDGDGNAISTADLLGRPLIVNFWYSTCAPCRKELPHFAAVHGELGDRIRFVGVNPTDTPEVNREFAAARGVAYELLRDPDAALVDGVGITAFPVTLFVRADGSIVRQTGELDEAELRSHAQELLG